MSIKIYFDMDGTLFNLYGKTNWLDDIINERKGVFNGEFLSEIDVSALYDICNKLMFNGVELAIITWLPMNASSEYEENCAKEKKDWVKKNMPFIKEVNCLSYGIPKQNAITKRTTKAFLIDDNKEVCEMWRKDENTNCIRIPIQVTRSYNVVDALRQIYNIEINEEGE